jgi:CRP-like cAMP-binding protein
MADEATSDSKRAILARHEFFRDLPAATLDRLALRARTATYAKGSRIFNKGDEGHGLLAVLEGVVKISAVSDEGREIGLNYIGAGEVFGEIALADSGPRTADVTAETACKLCVLDRRDFVPMIMEDPKIALKLLSVLAGRLRKTTQQVEDLSFEASPVRMARALFRLAEVQETLGDERPRIVITQRSLGETVGLSRESTNRLLRDWEERGLIDIGRSAVVILAKNRLNKMLRGEAG